MATAWADHWGSAWGTSWDIASVPTTSSDSAWGLSWGSAWGSSWGVLTVIVEPPPDEPPGPVVVGPVPDVVNTATVEFQRRGLHQATANALVGSSLQAIGMVEMQFSDWVRFWSGVGVLTWNGVPWYGSGAFGQIGVVEETAEIRAVGLQLKLSGLPLDVAVDDGRRLSEVIMGETWQGRPVRVYFAVLDDRRRFVGRPLRLFAGKMDQVSLKSSELLFTCESAMFDLQRTKARRYTSADQRAEFPNDAGCDAVASMQQVDLRWGTPSPN